MIERYDVGSDEMVPVTQDWCDMMQAQIGLLGTQREIIRAIAGMNILEKADDLRKIWNLIRSLGIEDVLAEAEQSRQRQEEISRSISEAMNDSLGAQ